MTDEAPTIHLIDDDQSVLRSLSRLLGAAGFRCERYETAEMFLGAHDPAGRGCVVVDLKLPGLDGFELQKRLLSEAPGRQVVFLTGRGDIPASVRAMRAGAVDFLTKPVEPEALIAAIERALERDAALRTRCDAERDARARLSTLTPREREVLDHVVQGLLNKQIAAAVGSAEKTVKIHRGRMMRKMGARSVAKLVRMVELLKSGGAG